MAEQAVVEAPVVQTPVTTVVETPAVTPPATPEPDLLTRVSQFELPKTPEKIENPPDQPELAGITDPVAKKAAAEAIERMRRGMQSDYTKKLEEAQKLVNQSKSWTPQRIQQELLTNPEFVTAAQMIQSSQQPVQDVNAYSVLSEPEKAKVDLIPGLKTELEQMKQQNQQNALLTSINQNDVLLKQKFPDYVPEKVNEAAQRFQKLTPAAAREYIYKADNYEIAVQKAYELGKQEGQGKLNGKLNIIAPQGSVITADPDKPVKQPGESDKNFFVRLGQHNLAKFKTQK